MYVHRYRPGACSKTRHQQLSFRTHEFGRMSTCCRPYGTSVAHTGSSLWPDQAALHSLTRVAIFRSVVSVVFCISGPRVHLGCEPSPLPAKVCRSGVEQCITEHVRSLRHCTCKASGVDKGKKKKHQHQVRQFGGKGWHQTWRSACLGSSVPSSTRVADVDLPCGSPVRDVLESSSLALFRTSLCWPVPAQRTVLERL